MATVVPAVNQIERHSYLTERALIAYHKKKDIVTEAYSPGGHKNAIREDPAISAIAAKHGVSPTQVILAWHTVIVIENEQRQKDNMTLPGLGEEDRRAGSW
ncbi:hypothetical protein EDD85DRAFT_799063 [Armillaria nabsnona]|nr:hypothetical protein EDD85DRAFT_799063 [Armillaria nabsnona]